VACWPVLSVCEKCDEAACAVDPVQTAPSRFLFFSPRVLFSLRYSLLSLLSLTQQGVLWHPSSIVKLNN
jgi:hypothetical protein